MFSGHCIGMHFTYSVFPSFVVSTTFDRFPKQSPDWMGFQPSPAQTSAGFLPLGVKGFGPE